MSKKSVFVKKIFLLANVIFVLMVFSISVFAIAKAWHYAEDIRPGNIGKNWTSGNWYFTTGNVGIGNTNPQYALDITGDVRFTGTLQGGSVPWARIPESGKPHSLKSESLATVAGNGGVIKINALACGSGFTSWCDWDNNGWPQYADTATNADTLDGYHYSQLKSQGGTTGMIAHIASEQGNPCPSGGFTGNWVCSQWGLNCRITTKDNIHKCDYVYSCATAWDEAIAFCY